jgi:SAM-dependent methyltransferase
MKKVVKKLAKLLARLYGFIATLPFRFHQNEINRPENLSHEFFIEYLKKTFNKPGMRVLEIGSRNVTGANFRSKFADADYIGFDFYDGENVDVVGDAHKLSTYFDGQERFDLIFSSAVFEHLHMPWVAAVECSKLLKVGGHVFIETHFSFSSHERPWHFFQFSDMGLRALFNDALGFDLIESGMSNPISGYFNHHSDDYLKYLPVAELYCHSEIYCRKRCDVERFNWEDVSIDSIVGSTRYPLPKKDL